MHIIEWVVNNATHLISVWGLPGVFFLMLLESANIPVPSEAIMPFAGFVVSEGHMSLASIVVAGVLGNLVGSWISYAVGLYGGRPFIDRYGKYVLLRHHHVELAERWFDRWGAPAVFFSRMVPIVRTFISLPAGIARMPFWKFTVYTLLGCVPWVLMLGWVGMRLGANWERIRPYLHIVDYVVIAVVLMLIAWAIYRWRRGRSTDVEAPDATAGDAAAQRTSSRRDAESGAA